MPSNATAKIELARRRNSAVVLVVALVIFAVSFLVWQMLAPKSRTLTAGGHSYSLELATTRDQQAKGLSGRQSMAQNHGMLFMFSREAQQCFWMKDMRFPLDIIWTNATHKVVFLERNLSPSTYPQTFCSGDPAAFVIELNAGEAQRSGIRVGEVLTF